MGLVTYRFGKQLWARVKACRTTTVITTSSSMAAVEEEEGGGRSLSIASDLTAPLLSDDDAYDEQVGFLAPHAAAIAESALCSSHFLYRRRSDPPGVCGHELHDEQGDDELARKVEVLNLNIAKLHSNTTQKKKKEKVPPPLAEGPSPVVPTTVVG